MSYFTAPKEVKRLNTMLGQELGRNPYGDSIFRWLWTEDLFWPAGRTGESVKAKVNIPIIGGAPGEVQEVDWLVPEYKKQRLTRKYKNSWLICKWLSPAELVGLRIGKKIGVEASEDDFSVAQVQARWESMFPGNEFPRHGWYIHTNWVNKPELKPTLEDTRIFIFESKRQMSEMSADALYKDMRADEEAEAARVRSRIEDEVEDCFTAFLNPEPGKRGGFVSFQPEMPKESTETKELVKP